MGMQLRVLERFLSWLGRHDFQIIEQGTRPPRVWTSDQLLNRYREESKAEFK